ncbi:MAG: hypothetical protein ACRYGM_01770 [Janthinobacterium lividum]
MAQQDAFALARSDLNDVLFANIGTEDSGMPLSVISALARQGLDPWREAGRLAKLPQTAATEGLARMIRAMPADLPPMPDTTAVAARLIALLPRQRHRGTGTHPVSSFEARPGAGAWADVLQLMSALLALAVLVALAAYVAPAPSPPAASLPGTAAPASQVPNGD